jgi:AcrR family transcriptional regulator
VRRRVAQACLDLLAEGHADLGPVEVSRRAGVSRATVHRWWPTRGDLLRAGLELHASDLDAPDTGSWERDLRLFAWRFAEFSSDPVEVTQNAVMAAGAHPDYTAAVLEHYAPIFTGWRAMLERGRARGEVADDVDADAVLLLALSPLTLVPLLYRRTFTHAEVDHLVDLVLRATSPR